MAEFTYSGRRWTGAIFLIIAVLMLVVGQTVLDSRLSKVGFILYYLVCAAFTLSAASVALVDMALLRKRARNEQRDLIEDAMREIEQDKAKRHGPKSEKPRDGIND